MATNKEKVKAPSKGPELTAEPKKEKAEVKAKESKEKKEERPKEETPVADSFAPKIPFRRWFKAKGFKPRWEAGMAAFTDTTQRRTMAEWDATFKSY